MAWSFNLDSSLVSSNMIDTEDDNRDSDLSDSELNSIVEGVKPGNTSKQTKFGVKKFTDWLSRRPNVNVSLETSPPAEIAKALRKFYLEVRNKNGKLPGPSTLNGIRAAIHRFITGTPLSRPINILQDTIFQPANEAFKSACKRFCKEGGRKPQHKPVLSNDDSITVGTYLETYTRDPVTLQEAVWFLIALNFGRRGREGYRDMRKNTFQVGVDAEKGRFLHQVETEQTKNHQGGSRFDSSDYQEVKVYEIPGHLSLVAVYEFYLSKLSDHCSLFQKPRKVFSGQGPWYQNLPLGVHTLDEMMPSISSHANLGRRYTNHSVRATMITTLAKAKIPATTIMTITGQKNASTLRHYMDEPDDDEKQECSTVLGNMLQKNHGGQYMDNVQDISDSELCEAYDNTMACSSTTGMIPSYGIASGITPLPSLPQMVIQSGAVLNNCTFTFNLNN